MSESPRNLTPDDVPVPTTPPARPKRRRFLRAVLWGVGGVLTLSVLVFLLMPTLLSSAPGRRVALGYVNRGIPGTLAVDGWSLKWVGGVRVSDLRLYDEAGDLILRIPRLDTGLTLLNALRGRYDVGTTTGDVELTRVVVEPDGRTNVERALGLTADKPDRPDGPADTLETLDRLRGSVTLGYGGQVSLHEGPTVRLRPSGVTARFGGPAGTSEAETDVTFDVLGPESDIVTDLPRSGRFVVVAGRTPAAGGDARLTLDARLEGDLGTAHVAVDVSQTASDRFVRGQAPGGEGVATLRLDLRNLGPLLGRFVTALPEGIRVVDARLTGSSRLTLRPDDTEVVIDLLGDAFAASAEATGQPVAVGPLALHVVTILRPGEDWLTRVSDLSLRVAGDVVTADIRGPGLTRLVGDARLDLDALAERLRPLGLLEDQTVGGRGVLTLRGGQTPAAADPQPGDASSDVAPTLVAELTLDSLRYGAGHADASMIDIPWMGAKVDVWAAGIDAGMDAGHVRRVVASVRTGDRPDRPVALAELEADGIHVRRNTVDAFELRRLTVTDLAWLVGTGLATLPGGTELTAGGLTAGVAGSYNGSQGTLTITRPLDVRATGVTLLRDGQRVLSDATLRLVAGGEATLRDGRTDVALRTLTFDSPVLTLRQPDGELIVLRATPDGRTDARGRAVLGADLVAITAIVGPSPDGPRVTGGRFDGELTFRSEGPAATARLSGRVDGLSVLPAGGVPTPDAAAQTGLRDEAATIDLRLTSGDHFTSHALVGSVRSGFALLDLRDLRVRTGDAVPQEDPLGHLVSADVSVVAPDLPRLYTLATAFMPPHVAADAAPDVDPDVTDDPPLRVADGSLSADVRVRRDGPAVTLVTDVRADRLVLARGQDRTSPLPVTLQADARVSADGAAAVRSLAWTFGQGLSLTGTGASAAVEAGRRLEGVRADVQYDWQRLLGDVTPLLDAQTRQTLQGLTIAGGGRERWVVEGVWATGRPFHEAVASLTGRAGLTFDRIVYGGWDARQLAIPLTLSGGMVTIGESVATLNSGTLDLSGLRLNLTSPDGIRADMPVGRRTWPLVRRATLNPVLADALGRFVNPVFPNSRQAQGLLDVTVTSLDGLLLGGGVTEPGGGAARLVFSLSDVQIVNPLGSAMLGSIGGSVPGLTRLTGDGDGPDVFEGIIRDAVVTIDHGKVRQDLTFAIGDPRRVDDAGRTRLYPLRFAGDIDLSSLAQNLTVSLPGGLLAKWTGRDDLERLLPDGLPLTLRGTTVSPQIDAGQTVQALLNAQVRERLNLPLPTRSGDPESAPGRPGDELRRGLEDLIGGRRGRDPSPQGPPVSQERISQERMPPERVPQRPVPQDRISSDPPPRSPSVPERTAEGERPDPRPSDRGTAGPGPVRP